MPVPASGLGAFAQNFVSGAVTRQELDLQQQREGREQAMHGIKLRAAKLDVERKEKEQPVLDKELQLRGSRADYEQSEVDFKKGLQDFENETKRIQAKGTRAQAQVGVGQSEAALANQPDELAVARENLNQHLLDSTLRQTANIYRIAKLGDMEAARDLYNKSLIVEPGHKAKSIKFGTVKTAGADGASSQDVPVLTIEDEQGQVRHIPRASLEKLDDQFGATYQKAGNNIVRITRDGKVTPMYEADVYGHTQDSDIYSKRTGEVKTPAAPGGVPKPSSREQARIDKRVTEGRTVVDKYFGISEFTKLDEAAQPAYNAVVNRMGGLIRGGAHPEAAANQALLEQKDGRLGPDGAPKVAPAPAPAPAPAAQKPAAASGTTGYTGPTPWRQ